MNEKEKIITSSKRRNQLVEVHKFTEIFREIQYKVGKFYTPEEGLLPQLMLEPRFLWCKSQGHPEITGNVYIFICRKLIL